jgi:D-amino-acid oxidase
MASSERRRVTVVGGGVIGLTVAYVLSDLFDVVLVAERVGAATNSRLATAVWHVYLIKDEGEIADDDPHLEWAEQTLSRLIDLSNTHPECGLEMIDGVELFRRPLPEAEPSWMALARRHLSLTMLTPDEVAAYNVYGDRGLRHEDQVALERRPVIWGYSLRAPATAMPHYLSWLEGEVTKKGVSINQAELATLADISDPGLALVNCCGIGARELVGDKDFVPYKGQYFVLCGDDGAPRSYIGDDDHPAGMAYVVPRAGQVAVGGSAEPGCESTSSDIRWEDVRARAGLYVPWIAAHSGEVGEPIVGIRPVRRTGVRLEVDRTLIRNPVIHNYGHGGSGFSLSWGCANRVLELVSGLSDDTGGVE